MNEVPAHMHMASVLLLQGLPGRSGRSYTAALGPVDTGNTGMQHLGQNLLHILTFRLLTQPTVVCVSVQMYLKWDALTVCLRLSTVALLRGELLLAKGLLLS